jgi:hypothetical protein
MTSSAQIKSNSRLDAEIFFGFCVDVCIDFSGRFQNQSRILQNVVEQIKILFTKSDESTTRIDECCCEFARSEDEQR